MTIDELVALENDSIRAFIVEHAHVFEGREVLDFGCGFQPYRDVVEQSGGGYTGWHDETLPGSRAPATEQLDERMMFGAVLCTQVIQYVPQPEAWLAGLRRKIVPRGHLLITGPTNWPEVDTADLHRFSHAGARRLLERAGYVPLESRPRAQIELGGFSLSVGWGVLARNSR